MKSKEIGKETETLYLETFLEENSEEICVRLLLIGYKGLVSVATNINLVKIKLLNYEEDFEIVITFGIGYTYIKLRPVKLFSPHNHVELEKFSLIKIPRLMNYLTRMEIERLLVNFLRNKFPN